jgi:putative transcriptional regulator
MRAKKNEPKTRVRNYKSDALEAIHSSVLGMYLIGAIDEATMREFDESCLAEPEDETK